MAASVWLCATAEILRCVCNVAFRKFLPFLFMGNSSVSFCLWTMSRVWNCGTVLWFGVWSYWLLQFNCHGTLPLCSCHLLSCVWRGHVSQGHRRVALELNVREYFRAWLISYILCTKMHDVNAEWRLSSETAESLLLLKFVLCVKYTSH